MTIFGIIFIILLFAGVWYLIYKANEYDYDYFFGTIFSGFITFILFLALCGIGSAGKTFEKSKTFGVTYICSLSSNSDVSGSFCLGSGTVNEKSYYYYMANTDKGYMMSKVEATTPAYIKEDCESKPFIEFTRYNCTKQNWFSKLLFEKEFFNEDREVVIHVPKGTVIKNYTVDISKLTGLSVLN